MVSGQNPRAEASGGKNIKTQEKYQLNKTGFSPNIKAEVARKIKIMGKRHSDPINNISHFLGRDGNQPV